MLSHDPMLEMPELTGDGTHWREALLAGRKLRVLVVGGGPAGSCCAETLAVGGCETFLIGGA